MNVAQTPIQDLLRDIPADARLIHEHSPTLSSSIPVGSLAAQALAKITALENELRSAQYRAVEAVGAVPATDEEIIKAANIGAIHTERVGRVERSPEQYRQELQRSFLRGARWAFNRTAPPSSKTQDDLAGAGGTRIIEPPEFAQRPSITDSMSKDDLWSYACLVGYRYELSEHDKLQSTLASRPKAPAPVPVVQGEAMNQGVTDDDRRTWDATMGGGGAAGGVGASVVTEDEVAMLVPWFDPEVNAPQLRAALQEFANSRYLSATPAPEQATTGSGQDSGSVHLGSGECGNVQAPEPRKSLNAKVADLLRPFLKPGQKVIWREAFRWHDDNGVLSNHYDGMSLPLLAEEFGYEWEFDFYLNHAAIISTASPAGEGEVKP